MEAVEIKNKWNWGYSVTLIQDGCGTVEIQFENGYEWGYITGLVVAKARQRQGIATQLMKRAEEVIREEGYDEAQLWVEKERTWTYEWYQRLGYKKIMDKDGHYKMRKLLGDVVEGNIY